MTNKNRVLFCGKSHWNGRQKRPKIADCVPKTSENEPKIFLTRVWNGAKKRHFYYFDSSVIRSVSQIQNLNFSISVRSTVLPFSCIQINGQLELLLFALRTNETKTTIIAGINDNLSMIRDNCIIHSEMLSCVYSLHRIVIPSLNLLMYLHS